MNASNDNDDKLAVTLTIADLRRLVRDAVQEVCPSGTPAREFLTAEQLADRLGVCTRSIKTMVSRDGLPTHLLGPRLVRFLWSEVEEWLMNRGKNLDGLSPRPTRGHLRRVRS